MKHDGITILEVKLEKTCKSGQTALLLLLVSATQTPEYFAAKVELGCAVRILPHHALQNLRAVQRA